MTFILEPSTTIAANAPVLLLISLLWSSTSLFWLTWMADAALPADKHSRTLILLRYTRAWLLIVIGADVLLPFAFILVILVSTTDPMAPPPIYSPPPALLPEAWNSELYMLMLVRKTVPSG